MSFLLVLVPLLVPLPGSPPLLTPRRESTNQSSGNTVRELLRKQFEEANKGVDTGVLMIYAMRHLVICEVLLVPAVEEITYRTRVAEWPVGSQTVYDYNSGDNVRITDSYSTDCLPDGRSAERIGCVSKSKV